MSTSLDLRFIRCFWPQTALVSPIPCHYGTSCLGGFMMAVCLLKFHIAIEPCVNHCSMGVAVLHICKPYVYVVYATLCRMNWDWRLGSYIPRPQIRNCYIYNVIRKCYTQQNFIVPFTKFRVMWSNCNNHKLCVAYKQTSQPLWQLN